MNYWQTLLKVTFLYRCFSRFLNYTNGTKSRNRGSHLKVNDQNKIISLCLMILHLLERVKQCGALSIYLCPFFSKYTMLNPLHAITVSSENKHK